MEPARTSPGRWSGYNKRVMFFVASDQEIEEVGPAQLMVVSTSREQGFEGGRGGFPGPEPIPELPPMPGRDIPRSLEDADLKQEPFPPVKTLDEFFKILDQLRLKEPAPPKEREPEPEPPEPAPPETPPEPSEDDGDGDGDGDD